MKTLITITTLLIALTGLGQTTIDKSSIDSGGAVATDGTLNIIYTIGEVALQETTLGTIHISEGFISAVTMKSLGITGYTQLVGVKLYPNPATDFINIRFTTTANYEINVYDLLGKEIEVYHVNNSDAKRIAIDRLSNAVYLILIKNLEAKQYKTYKIIKH